MKKLLFVSACFSLLLCGCESYGTSFEVISIAEYDCRYFVDKKYDVCFLSCWRDITLVDQNTCFKLQGTLEGGKK